MQSLDELSLETTTQSFRILSLDGGGAKGFYTLGVLRELEAHTGKPLHEVFGLIFGTSTGAIIASLLALGRSVDDIHALYKKHVVKVMQCKSAAEKTAALKTLATEVYADTGFDEVKTGLGIVSTRWDLERPMIFKADASQAHGRKATFENTGNKRGHGSAGSTGLKMGQSC